MSFAAQLQAAKGRLSARQAASAVSPLLSVRTMEKWLADEMTPPEWTHEWILSAVRSDEGCRDWPCEVHTRDQINGNPHMQINRAATPKEALAAYRAHMEATHQHLGAVTLTVRTGKARPPTCKLRTTQRPRTRKGQNVSDQTPAAVDSANTTDASSRLSASVLFGFVFTLWEVIVCRQF